MGHGPGTDPVGYVGLWLSISGQPASQPAQSLGFAQLGVLEKPGRRDKRNRIMPELSLITVEREMSKTSTEKVRQRVELIWSMS